MILNLCIVLSVWIYSAEGQSSFEIQNIRLSGDKSTKYEGRVEVMINNVWGTVCDDQWDNLDAAVVCRFLGYNFGGKAFSNAKYGIGNGPIHLDDVSCSGDEDNLDKCKLTRHTSGCQHSEDAGVKCVNTSSIPSVTTTSPTTTTKKTGPVADRCPAGQKNPDVQLVNSNGIEGVGYVEVRNPADKIWGSMCDDMINENVAKVICGSLCFNTTWARPGAIIKDLGEPRKPIILDDVICTGSEKQVQNCKHSPWGQSNCNNKTEVAKVTCVNLKTTPIDPPIPVLECRQGYLIALFNRSRDPALEEKHLSIGKTIIGSCNLKKDTDPNFITIRIPFEECGTIATTNKTHIIYSNVIKYDYTRQEGSISRVNTYMVQVSCEMPRNYSADKNIEPLTETVTKKAQGVFVINMKFYLNNSFTQPVKQYPVRMTLGDWLNVALILESVDSRLKLVVPDCIATPTASRKSRNMVPLFLNKCQEEQSLGFFPLSQNKFGFRYQSFVFVNFTEVYIHCGAFVCLASETGAECDRSCKNNKPTTPSGRRRRRDVTITHTKYWVNSGPMYIYGDRHSGSMNTRNDHVSQLNMTRGTIKPDTVTARNLHPTTRNLHPTARDLHSTTRNLHPTTNNLHPTTSNLQPTTSNLQPTTSNLQPTTSNIHPTTSNIQPTTSNLQPTTSNLHSTTSNLQPTTNNLQPTTNNLQPTTSNLQPTTSNLQPTTSNIQPTTKNLQPTTNTGDITRTFHTTSKTKPPEQVVTKPSIAPAKELGNLMKVQNSHLQTLSNGVGLDPSVVHVCVTSVIILLSYWL